MEKQMSACIYINHTQKEIRCSPEGTSVYAALAAWPSWDIEDNVICHNLHFAELLPVVLLHLSSDMVELVKEQAYSISGSACANIAADEYGISCEFDEDDDTLYLYDTETETMISLETGLPVQPPETSSSEETDASSTTDLPTDDESSSSDETKHYSVSSDDEDASF